jgi:choline dehydrogenase-like flavoprotein
MIIDAMEIPHDSRIEANICIIGGGAAGIFLALRLAEENLDTLVLEAGSLKNDRSSQALYKGEVSGLPYELDGARTRRLGGSTNCWGGFCLPLDRTMFCRRSWLTDGHWPFDANEMTRHYYKAANFLGLDAKLFSNKESITPEQYLLPMRTHHLTTSVS